MLCAASLRAPLWLNHLEMLRTGMLPSRGSPGSRKHRRGGPARADSTAPLPACGPAAFHASFQTSRTNSTVS